MAPRQKPLTMTQRSDLTALTKPDSYQEGYGCTNRTMEALAKRGFVKFHWDNPLKSSFGKWKITEEGRQFLVQL
jgi:hypothetical protein